MPGPAGNRPNDGSQGDESGGASAREGSDFENALEELDGHILSEREAILARRNETAGQGRRPAPEGPETSGGSQPKSPASGASEQRAPTPAPKPPPKLPVPPDVADATDDDVVCRQIREAAVAESDVELREKLWDEYRRCRER